MPRSSRMFLMALVPLLSPSAHAVAQVAQQSVVRIQVVDSAGRPLANADVSVIEGLSKAIASGITDTAGVRTLVIPAAGEYQVVVRRLGYLRAFQFITAAAGDIALRVPMTPSAILLPAVTVTADADVNRRAYHVDADDIAASHRPILDGYDVLRKLRPEMVDARQPTTTIAGKMADACTLQEVWVNGQRITLAPQDDRLAMEKAGNIRAQQATAPRSASRGKGLVLPGPLSIYAHPLSGIASVSMNVLSVLGSIHPEHIEEIDYADCRNFSLERPHTRNAVFVVLKPGVQFAPGKGSYVGSVPLAIVGNRLRLIGVFDELSGQPLPDVSIVDSATGTFAVTSETGTATLAFLPDGAHTLRIRKEKYSEQSIHVMISAEDSVPITLMMTAAKER